MSLKRCPECESTDPDDPNKGSGKQRAICGQDADGNTISKLVTCINCNGTGQVSNEHDD